jgi:acyl-CoA synthetase (AMP-forming)/AMP-acid ligase II
MVYTSRYAELELFKSGIIQFLFSNRTHQCPENRPIFVDAIDGRSISFAQLKDYVLRFAAGLQDVCDFREDDVLALFAPNNVSNCQQ